MVCPPSSAEAITVALNTNPFLTALPLPRPDILAPADLDFNTGTAEILRLTEITELVKSDFVVLPCDLVCEIEGEKLLQAWAVKSSSLSQSLGSSKQWKDSALAHSGGLGVFYDAKADTPIKKEETDFIATSPVPASPIPAPKGSIFPKLSKLVYSMPTDTLKDLTEEKKGLPVRHGLLRANPRVRMFTKHRDAHIYIFPRWILDFVKENERLDSIAEDVVGWWAKAGWQSGLADKLKIRDILSKQGQSEEVEATGDAPSPHEQSFSDKTAAQLRGSSQSPTQGTSLDAGDQKKGIRVPPMLAYMHSGTSQAPGSLIRRVDTAQLLLAISLQLAKVPSLEEAGAEPPSPYAHSKKVAYPEGIKSRTTVTKQDCLIAENVTIEEKTSIKECVIGAGCQINEGAKLSQCLLMEGVVIGKACKLTKCILGKRCVIGDGSVLTDCEVQENLMVEPKSKYLHSSLPVIRSDFIVAEDKDNKLMSSEGLEATEAEMEEVLQEDEIMDSEEAAITG